MPTTAKGTPYVVSTDLVANYPTVSSDLADHIDDNVTYNAQSINAQTGTTYTFALADATLYKLVTATNAAASTYTVPPQSSITWVTGNVLRILNQGAGAVTLTPGSGVTLNGATLVLSQYQYAELHRTASNTWTVTGISTPPGLVKITDSTFSAVASVSVNNCFSASYDQYQIVFEAVGSTGTSADLTLRMRASGVDTTASNYLFAGVTVTNAAGPTREFTSNGTSFYTGGIGDDRSFRIYNIGRPFDAVQTTFITGFTGTGSTSSTAGNLMGRLNDTTSYDGFTLTRSAGTITGTLRVYGYRD